MRTGWGVFVFGASFGLFSAPAHANEQFRGYLACHHRHYDIHLDLSTLDGQTQGVVSFERRESFRPASGSFEVSGVIDAAGHVTLEPTGPVYLPDDEVMFGFDAQLTEDHLAVEGTTAGFDCEPWSQPIQPGADPSLAVGLAT